MKKFFAILLASAMMFSLCAVSVFAESEYVTPTEEELEYLDFDALGEIIYYPGINTIWYKLQVWNLMDSTLDATLYMQCVATYSDDSFDVGSHQESFMISSEGSRAINREMYLSSRKTLVSVNAECRVYQDGSDLETWLGYIDYPSTLGINA